MATDVEAMSGASANELAPEEALHRYKVVYKGGHPDYPKAKHGILYFDLYADRFEIQPTKAAKWFKGLSLPYATVIDLQVVGRQVSTAESLLGGLNSRQLNQDNNIHISYEDGSQQILLRLEMLTGVTVMGQAKKCQELEDRLRNLAIPDKFKKSAPATTTSGQGDIPGQIAKLAILRDQGVLSDDEFQAKKSELLARM